MKATEVLVEEHQVIRRVITALGTAAQALERGQLVRPGFFIEVSDFIKGFADGSHHHKEEEVLFPALEAQGAPEESNQVAGLLSEHVRGRLYCRSLREAARKLGMGDETARTTVIQSALAYAGLLWSHIEKEDNSLFPMANQVLPVAQQDQMAEEFRRLECEESAVAIRKKYLALTEALETEANALRV